MLRFDNGVLGTVKAYEARPYGHDVRTEVVGEKAAIRIEQPTTTFTKVFERSRVSSDYPYWFIERFRESYVREIQEFVKCIVEDIEPKVTALNGLMSVKIAEAARSSLMDVRVVEV
jgi:myo-inositol 2-dehydrogenase/D-chiro-inositol 1-dehydrogenase